MKSALNFKGGLITLTQAGHFYHNPIQSEQELQDSIAVTDALKRTCNYWHRAIGFFETVDAEVQLRRSVFLAQRSAALSKPVSDAQASAQRECDKRGQ